MKKVAVVVIALVLALFAANTALAKYVDDSENHVIAKSGSIDIKIVERTKDLGNGKEYSNEAVDAVSSINEALGNLAPGDVVTLSYRIVNNGSIDVLLDGIKVSIDNQELSNYLNLKWTLTQYKDSVAVSSVSNKANGEALSAASGNANVSFSNIVLRSGNQADDYCVLELQITLDENYKLTSTAQETVFEITPLFSQY